MYLSLFIIMVNGNGLPKMAYKLRSYTNSYRYKQYDL